MKITIGKVRILAEQKKKKPEILGHKSSSSSSSFSLLSFPCVSFFQATEYTNRERLPCSEQSKPSFQCEMEACQNPGMRGISFDAVNGEK